VRTVARALVSSANPVSGAHYKHMRRCKTITELPNSKGVFRRAAHRGGGGRVFPFNQPPRLHVMTTAELGCEDEEGGDASKAHRRHFLRYQFGEWFTAQLIEAAQAFDGDLQSMLLLAIIGQVHLRRALALREGLEEPDWRDVQISASRLADITHINRETVRRKLKAMEQRGWLEQTPNASWRLAMRDGRVSVADDLGELDHRTLENFVKMIRRVKEKI
jgi:hypothetical protein